MMESNRWPLDPAPAAELVVRVIADLDASDEQRDVLLSDLLCAAWGCVLAQHREKMRWRDSESNREHHDFQAAARILGLVPICRTSSASGSQLDAIRLQGFLVVPGTGQIRRGQLARTDGRLHSSVRPAFDQLADSRG
jgi:hypothetical protein